MKQQRKKQKVAKSVTIAQSAAAKELLSIRASIKQMKAREQELGDLFRGLIDVGTSQSFEGYEVSVIEGVKTTIDREKLIEKYGEKVIKQFEKVTVYTSVKVQKE